MKANRTGLLAFIVVFSTILIVSLIFTLNGRFTVQGESSTASSFVTSSKSSSRSVSSSKPAVSNTQSQFDAYAYLMEERTKTKLEAQKLKEDLMENQTYKINIDVLEKEFKRELTPYDWWNILQLIAEDSRYSYGFGNYGIDTSALPNPYTPKDAKPHTYYNKYFHITYPAQILKSDSHHLTFSARDVVLLKNFNPTFSKDEAKCLFAINHYSYEAFSECSLAICAKLKSDTSDQIVPEDILFTDYEISLYGNKGFQQYRPVTLNNQTFTYIVFDENEYLCFVKNNIVFTVSLSWSHSIFRNPAEHEAYYAQQDEMTKKWNQQLIEMLHSLTFH